MCVKNVSEQSNNSKNPAKMLSNSEVSTLVPAQECSVVSKAEPMKSVGRGAKILQELKALKERENVEALSSQLKNVKISDSQETLEAKSVSRVHSSDSPHISASPYLKIDDITRTFEGTEITTRLNCLRLQFKNQKFGKAPIIYQYHATFSPDIDGRSTRCRLVRPLLDGYTSVFDGSIAYIYDMKLENTSLKTSNPNVEIRLQMVKELNEYPTFVLNNIFRAVMTDIRMVLMRRSYFSITDSIRLPQHRLEVWPGFVTSIDYRDNPKIPGNKEMILTMDVSNRVLRTVTCLDMLCELMDVCEDRSQSKDRMRDQFTKSIVGSVVLTRYNNRTYRIDGIEWSKNIDDVFSMTDGTELSFRQYYEKFHNLKCTDNSQPLLISRIRRIVRSSKFNPTKYTGKSDDGRSVLLIPEFCYLTGLTDALRADFRAMKDLSAIVHLSPSRRLEKLKTFVDNIRSSEAASKRLDDWGIELPTNNVVTVPARVLPNEKLIMGNGREIFYGNNADWGKELSRSSVLNAVPVNSWLLLYPRKLDNLAHFFEDTLLKEAHHLGLSFSKADHRSIPDDRTGTYVRALREELGDGRRSQLAVIIFPSQRDDRYSAVKRLCCVDIPIASQVIVARSLSNANKAKTICQRIMLQINCKMGGFLWAVPIPVTGLMVCGIDVYHSGSGTEGRSSVGAIVCSSDKECTRWYSRVTIQSNRQELMDDLKTCFSAALRNYHSVNLQLPQKIILFRDGVGDGNFNVVKNYEIEQLTACFASFSDSYCPQFAAMIIHKRINNRIMSMDDHNTSGSGVSSGRCVNNPQPGTVVDTPLTIRSRANQEFYLVSQHVNQGTVNPTRFILVANTTKLNLDKLQRIAFKLTHMYYNWPGTVRVPAPCVYAHKLAYLIGQNVQFLPSEQLSNRLFYL
ncbi:hypothetical protein GJ496_002423 [Pomphorhynchus laevis]|nr:hypothetical protein GJ496_002423 [Pomphorhynchus laevis]